MNYTCSAFNAHSYNDPHQIAITRTDPQSSSIPMLLTLSAVFLAVDATIHAFKRRSQEKEFTAGNNTHQPLAQFVAKTEQILIDFQELEKTLELEHKQRRRHSAPVVPRSQVHLITNGEKGNKLRPRSIDIESFKGDKPSAAFSAFCERLLLMNRIWEQEKQMKSLRAALESKSKVQNDTAFKTFCDQLLLWNRIWKLEREVNMLAIDGEKMKRSRVATITRAAKKMVLDVQKERLVEEFVKDMIKEVEDSKEAARKQKEEHEREVAEINGDWIKEYRKIVRDLNALKLAQEARLVEQEVSNEMEQSLHDNLQISKKRIEALEEKIYSYEESESLGEDTMVERSYDEEPTDVELDTLSELSSSSTCVSIERNSGRTAKVGTSINLQRKRRVSHPGVFFNGPSPDLDFESSLLFKSSTPPTSSKDDPYVLKPLVFDNANTFSATSPSIVPITHTCNHSGRHLVVRNRTVSLKQPSASTSSIKVSGTLGVRKSVGSAKKPRAPWRV